MLFRSGAALYIGGMGARSKNFYNDIFAKSGYVDEAKVIQDLYLAGDKKAAEEAIPADYLAKSSLIGPEGFVKERLYALRESGCWYSSCYNELRFRIFGKSRRDHARRSARAFGRRKSWSSREG